jgi:hypothetical protein
MNFKRLLVYSLIGIVFGVLDWYGLQVLLRGTYTLSQGNLVVQVMGDVANWAAWLLPAFPAAVYEAWRSGKALWSGMAVVTVWLSAVVAYYLYYAYLLAFVGLNEMQDLLVFRPHPIYFGQLWSSTLRDLIFRHIWERGLVALVVGFIVGGLAGWATLRWLAWHSLQSRAIPTTSGASES